MKPSLRGALRHRRSALAYRRHRQIVRIDDLNRHPRDHRLAAQLHVGIRHPAPGRKRAERHALRDPVAVGRGFRGQRQVIGLAEDSQSERAGVDQDAPDGLAGGGAALADLHTGEETVEVIPVRPGPYVDFHHVGRICRRRLCDHRRFHHQRARLRSIPGQCAGSAVRDEYRQRRQQRRGKLESTAAHHLISDCSTSGGSIAGSRARPHMSSIWPAVSTTTSLPRTDARWSPCAVRPPALAVFWYCVK